MSGVSSVSRNSVVWHPNSGKAFMLVGCTIYHPEGSFGQKWCTEYGRNICEPRKRFRESFIFGSTAFNV